jgi:ABC-2 type transport system ATP-binding protein
MSDSAVICVDGYRKVYGSLVAVANLSFQVPANSVLGLIGPNGAGKTTTLRAIAGIIPPTSGSISVSGFDLADDSIEAKRRLAYVPDDPRLFDSLTVWEHLDFVAQAYEVEDGEAKTEALLEEFELCEKRDTLGHELSRGMRQKVAICCGFLHEPAAILLDEPMTGLDPMAIRHFRESIASRAEQGAAVIISSHLLKEVEDLCTDLLILIRGEAQFTGSLEDAQRQFSDLESASLEEVFFRAMEE